MSITASLLPVIPIAAESVELFSAKEIPTTTFPPAAKKLTYRAAYRVRVDDYRIIYVVQDDTITIVILALGHRRDV